MKNNPFSPFAFLCLLVTSLACSAGHAPANAKPLGPGRHALSLTLNDLERTYLVHVPPGYASSTPVPLVVMLHGGGGTAKAALWETGWAEKADAAGFIAVFPNAQARDPSRRSSFARNPQLWNDGSDRFYPEQKKAPDDVGFLAAMLDDLSARFAIDQQQIFFTGFSNGASMTFRAGAALSQRIAAIAPVAGACWLDPVGVQQPVPMLYITGNADPLNLIEGGVPRLANGGSDSVRAKAKPPVRESILRWAKAIHAAPTPISVTEDNGVRIETYSTAAANTDAALMYVVVDGLGHTWAGGKSLLPESLVGASSNKIHATDMIWHFFTQHAKTR